MTDHAGDQQAKATENEDANEIEILGEHDTPPPIIIGEGSLFVESKHDFRLENRVRYTIRSARDVSIHAIRLLKGNGETHVSSGVVGAWHPTEACRITINLRDDLGNTTSIIEVGADRPDANGRFFYIEVEDGKELRDRGTPSRGRKRGHHLRFKNRNNQEERITRVRVRDPGHDFDIDVDGLRERGAEFQIMIWLNGIN
jgi:hypothetical protein